jgi:carboxyl-terminal processing protease
MMGTLKKLILVPVIMIMASGFLNAQQNGFVQAYDSMHQVFSVYYPMGKWKGIKWDSLNTAIRPKIVTSGASGDTVGFYTALVEYVNSIHDGHTNIRHGWAAIRAAAMYRQIGGSYGFAVTGLDDDRIVVRLVNTGSPAGIAGMTFGAQVLEVNDNPVLSVLDTVPVLWADLVPATKESKKLNQFRMIGRAPVGHSMKIKFLNRGSSLPVTATLTAVDDQYATYNQTTMFPSEPGPNVLSEVLDGGYGYIKINALYGDSVAVKNIYTDIRDALSSFIANNAPGLVLDIRVDGGGYDALAAAIAGFFYNEKAFYEYQTWYDPDSDSLEIWPYPIGHFNPATLSFEINPSYPAGALYTEPQGICFSKPVMVLVGPRAISSAEGIPMMLKKLPLCKILSFYGSNGSFALVERAHYLFPSSDLYLRYPYGVSMDQNFSVQDDSDSTMTGGVIPDIRVPMNDTVIDQLYIDSLDVEVLYALKMMKSSQGIGNNQATGNQLILGRNTPNPFNRSTVITYHLPGETMVNLTLLDRQGRVLKTLVDEKQRQGDFSVELEATALKPGLYFYRLKAGNSTITRKCQVY